MKYKTITALARKHGFVLRSQALGFMKPVSPTVTAYVSDADGGAPFSAHMLCTVKLHDHSTGKVGVECHAANFERALLKVEAWRIRDLERRADASNGLLFLAPQAE